MQFSFFPLKLCLTTSLSLSLCFFNIGTDLTSSDRHSEHFLKKVNRARLALARTDSIRSVSQSLKGKPPYRRAVSVPLHLITKGVAPPKGTSEHFIFIWTYKLKFSKSLNGMKKKGLCFVLECVAITSCCYDVLVFCNF